MKFTRNVGGLDVVLRLFIAEVLLLGAFFWAHGAAQIVLYLFSAVAFFTATFQFCGLYTIVGVTTCPIKTKEFSKNKRFISAAALILFLMLGAYYSNFFSKKFFLEDFSRMNHYYKQTLFFTGQNNRDESVKNYKNLVTEYSVFHLKYSKYHPYVIASDKQFNGDLEKVNKIIISLGDRVVGGNLPEVHIEFEAIRPVFQDILKRNGFSMLAVYLVDFHDVMELVLDGADAKSSSEVISAYTIADSKLKAVEEVANDEEIQNIRQKLETVLSLAKSGNSEALPKAGGELKSAFVKVYLKRG